MQEKYRIAVAETETIKLKRLAEIQAITAVATIFECKLRNLKEKFTGLVMRLEATETENKTSLLQTENTENKQRVFDENKINSEQNGKKELFDNNDKHNVQDYQIIEISTEKGTKTIEKELSAITSNLEKLYSEKDERLLESGTIVL